MKVLKGGMMKKMKIIVLVVLFFALQISMSLAFIIPSMEELVERSDWVVVAKVVEILPGVNKHIQIEVSKTLKPKDNRAFHSIYIEYELTGEGEINFNEMKNNGKKYIFFLKKKPWDGSSFNSAVLINEIYGVFDADRSYLKKIKATVRAEGGSQ